MGLVGYKAQSIHVAGQNLLRFKTCLARIKFIEEKIYF
jgi:hypothetical protein